METLYLSRDHEISQDLTNVTRVKSPKKNYKNRVGIFVVKFPRFNIQIHKNHFQKTQLPYGNCAEPSRLSRVLCPVLEIHHSKASSTITSSNTILQ